MEAEEPLFRRRIWHENRPSLCLAQFTDLALLLLRLMVGLIFFASGWKHAFNAETRSKDIDEQKFYTFSWHSRMGRCVRSCLRFTYTIAAIGLIFIMFGAIQKKIFLWHTSFWGKHETEGWSYEIMMILMNFVISTTAGGRFVLEQLFHSASKCL